MKKLLTALTLALTALFLTLSLSSCMKAEDYYTKADVEALIAELNSALAEKEEACNAKIQALREEYEAKVAELEAADAENTAAIAALTADYEAKIAELEAADALTAEDLEALTTKYETDLEALIAADEANADAIEDLTADYEAKVAEIEADYEEKFESVNELITALQEADLDNVRRIAILEAQIAALLSKHEHTFGNWSDFGVNANVYCEQRFFFRACTECNVIELKTGSYNDHDFDTVTTPPTCTAKGFDTLTCKTCGKVEIKNETDIIPHDFKTVTTPPTCTAKGFDTLTCNTCGKVEIKNETEVVAHDFRTEYSSDGTFHWYNCKSCDERKSIAEHTTDDSGYCTVCDAPAGPTNGILYDLSSNGSYAEVIGYSGSAKRVIIASEYNGVPVRTIYSEAFKETSITSVIIPDSVTSIGNSAFYYCKSLTSVTIGNGVTSIGSDAFRGCSSLTRLTIGNSVTSIGGWAFSYCRSLTSITIPDSVTSIGEGAFDDCSSLTSVTIGNGVTSIGSNAFSYCNSALYTEYEFGRYVGSSENPYAVLIELTNKNLSTYTIHENTKYIGYQVFAGCGRLSTITIPDSVTSIGEDAFYECSSLTSVTIGNSVTSIGNWAFRYCTSLTSVTIGNCVTSIGNSAFGGCSSLASVTIPDSVTSIGNSAFGGCSSLTSVTIGNGVTSIGSSAFYGCSSLTSVTIPNSVTSIGNYAFSGCSSLTSVTIGNGVTSIGEQAFYYCTSLTSVTIPNSVTSIGAYAFNGCSSLTSVTIGNGVTSIGERAFDDCSSLTSVTIPNSVTSIGGYAFFNCSSLTSVTVGNGVTSIGECAFGACSSLASVYINDLAAWCAISFAVNSPVANTSNPLYYAVFLYLNGELVTDLVIPDGVTSINDYAFYSCDSLMSVTIPNSVTSIGNNAFYNCISLKTINYCGTEAKWDNIEKSFDWINSWYEYTLVFNLAILDNLQDETLDYYEYPMDQVVGTNGAIIYWASGDDKNKYMTEADEQPVGFYKNAFIEITDTVFNYVYIVSNGVKKAGWAFVTEMPEVGEKVTYAGNFATLKKFTWVVDTNGTAKVEIPEGAKYLVVYYEEAGNSYLPASITFTKEEAVDTENAYEYPMENVTPIEGYINHYDSATTNNGKYHYLRFAANNESHAFIDLTGLDYNTVTLRGPANGENTNYAFLTKIPTVDNEKISYATGYSDMIWYGMGNGDLTVTIPADAVCLVVLHHYSDGTVTMPESIVFSNRETVPAEMLKNDTLTSYEYPMTEINASMGTIASADNKFIRNYRWVTALVPIEGCVFDKVVFEIDEKYGKISYGFLSEYPIAGEVVSWAGTTGMTTVTNANGSTVTVDIPDDAKVLVVYWHDWDDANGTRIYYIPESVTFIKAEDAGTTTPPIFSTPDSEDAA